MVGFALPAELIAKIDDIARAQMTSRSAIMRRVVQAHINQLPTV